MKQFNCWMVFLFFNNSMSAIIYVDDTYQFCTEACEYFTVKQPEYMFINFFNIGTFSI